MGDVSLELVVELLKDVQRQLFDVKSEMSLMRSENAAFRGYLDGLSHDSHRNNIRVDRQEAELSDLRTRLEAVERRLERME